LSWRWHLRPRVHAAWVGHPDGETDRRSRRRGRAAGIPARTIRVPPVSSIWIPVRRWAPVPGSSSGPDPAGGHARERRGGAGRHSPGRQGAGGCGCPERSSSYSGITLSDEGGSGRTRADPPICARDRLAARCWAVELNWMICALVPGRLPSTIVGFSVIWGASGSPPDRALSRRRLMTGTPGLSGDRQR
jgi:hypothetical protein